MGAFANPQFGGGGRWDKKDAVAADSIRVILQKLEDIGIIGKGRVGGAEFHPEENVWMPPNPEDLAGMRNVSHRNLDEIGKRIMSDEIDWDPALHDYHIDQKELSAHLGNAKSRRILRTMIREWTHPAYSDFAERAGVVGGFSANYRKNPRIGEKGTKDLSEAAYQARVAAESSFENSPVAQRLRETLLRIDKFIGDIEKNNIHFIDTVHYNDRARNIDAPLSPQALAEELRLPPSGPQSGYDQGLLRSAGQTPGKPLEIGGRIGGRTPVSERWANEFYSHAVANDESLGGIINSTPGENARKQVIVPPNDSKNILDLKPVGFGLPRSHRTMRSIVEGLMGYVPFTESWDGRKLRKQFAPLRLYGDIGDVNDYEMMEQFLPEVTDFITRMLKRSPHVANAIASKMESEMYQAFGNVSFGGRGEGSLLTSDFRIPHLANVPGGTKGAPTIQDVAARLPEYVKSGRMTSEQEMFFETLRKALEPYEELMVTSPYIKMERGGIRGDIVPGGFYIPRGSGQRIAADRDVFDMGNYTGQFGSGTKISALKHAEWDSMSDALDDLAIKKAGGEPRVFDGYQSPAEAIHQYIVGVRKLGYQDYMSRIILDIRTSDNNMPLWFSKRRLVSEHHKEVSRYVEEAMDMLRNVEGRVRGQDAELTRAANQIAIYLNDPQATDMSRVISATNKILKHGKVDRDVKSRIREVNRALDSSFTKRFGRIKPAYRGERVAGMTIRDFYIDAVGNAENIASSRGLRQMDRFYGLQLGDRYYPEVLRVALRSAFPEPQVVRSLREIIRTQGYVRATKEALLTKERWGRYLMAENKFYSQIGTTFDNSMPMIQGLPALFGDIFRAGFGTRAAMQLMKITAGRMTAAEMMRHYPSAAMIKTNLQVWNPLQFPEHARLLLGRTIAMFDEMAVAGGRMTAEDWAIHGLRIVGHRHEYSVQIMERLPLVARVNQAFGYTGDATRLKWADQELEIMLRKSGKTLQELKDDGSVDKISKSVSRSLGFSETGEYSLPSIMLFAPQFAKSRVENIMNMFWGIRPGAPIDQRMTAKHMWQFVGGVVGVTLMINHLLGNDTDIAPVRESPHYRKTRTSKLTGKIPGAAEYGWEHNPNFLTIRWEGKDYSLLGAHDSMLRIMIGAAQGDIGVFNTLLAGVPRISIDFFNQSNIFGESISSMEKKIAVGEKEYFRMAGIQAYIADTHAPWALDEASKMFSSMAEEVINKDWRAAAVDLAQAGSELISMKMNDVSITDYREQLTEDEYDAGRVSSRTYNALEPWERREMTSKTKEIYPEAFEDMPEKVDEASRHMANVAALGEKFKASEDAVFKAWRGKRSILDGVYGGMRLDDNNARSMWWDAYNTFQKEKSGMRSAYDFTFNEEIQGMGSEKQKEALSRTYDLLERDDISLKSSGEDETYLFNTNKYLKEFTDIIKSLDKNTADYVWRNKSIKSNFPDEWRELFRERDSMKNVTLYENGRRVRYRVFSTYGVQKEIERAQAEFKRSIGTPEPVKVYDSGIIHTEKIVPAIKELVEKVK